MNNLIEYALQRKPLQLVRKQAHLSDPSQHESRYTAASYLDREDVGGDTGDYEEGYEAFHATSSKTESTTSSSHQQHQPPEAPMRHMSLFDLTAFGVGCTIGSGVFVLAGVAAHSYAGPAASISYLVAGAVAALSGLPYAELSAAFPMDGSTYAYSYITLGEVFALMSSLCQTLEYGGSSAAVARSWGNKFVDWLRERHSDSDGNALPQWVDSFLDPGFGINPMAAIIAFLCTLLLLWGVQESKMATNVVSSAKLSLITFMILSGFLLASDVIPQRDENNPRPATFSNWDPFVPPEFGPSGIIQGSSILFFAFLGYDQICNLSGEAKNPVKDVPRAVVYTLMIDGGIYMMAALALTAMLPYTEISTVSGFPRAFGANGWIWAEKLTAIGEIVTLPLVVLTGVQSQTRLLFAMSKDKLVPELFGRLTFAKKSASPCGCINACSNAKKEDKIGNLTANVRFCGLVIVLLAAFVPFQYMDDLISAGALFLFSLTDCCLLILRYKCPSESFVGTVEYDDTVSIFSIATVRKELSLGRLLILLNILSFASGLSYAFIPIAALQIALTVVFALLTLGITIYMALYCPEQSTTRFSLEGDGYGIGRRRFRTPLVPYLPALGIFANWFMIANVGWVGIVMLVCYLLFGILVYGTFCSGKSLVTTTGASGVPSYMNDNLQGRLSPSGSGGGLCEALLGAEWEDENEAEKNVGDGRDIKKELSGIETPSL